jgi:cytochrome P450
MRLHPVVPIIFRQATRDTRIRSRSRSYLVPKGTFLAVHIMAMHHSGRHWERPKEFLPVRCHDVQGSLAEAPLLGLWRLRAMPAHACSCTLATSADACSCWAGIL